MAYWIVVGSPENFGITRGRGFDISVFKTSRRREASEMKAGDKLVFYLTGVMKLAGIATVESPYFEDHTPVWRSEKKPGEDFPFRVRVQPDIVLDEAAYLDVRDIGPRLAYPK